MSESNIFTTEADKRTFFVGAADGSAQKALWMLGEPNVMLSSQTKNDSEKGLEKRETKRFQDPAICPLPR